MRKETRKASCLLFGYGIWRDTETYEIENLRKRFLKKEIEKKLERQTSGKKGELLKCKNREPGTKGNSGRLDKTKT